MRNTILRWSPRLCSILLLIVLTAIILFLELPQGYGWIRKPHVLTLALPGIVLIHLGTRPQRRELSICAVLAAALFLTSVAACRNGLEVLLAGSGSLGVASLLGLGIRRTVWQPKTSRPGPFAAAAMLCVFSAAVGFFFLATVALAPRTFDTYLYAFDQSLGLPSFVMGCLFSHWPLLKSSSLLVYILLPFVMAAFYTLQLLHPTRSPLNIIAEFTVAAIIGWILYIVYPAVGPIYAFPNAFPVNPPPLSALRIEFLSLPTTAARNCMPSLHTTWALLVFWNARPFGRTVKMLATVFLVLTVAATLGLGEHYLIDLVVALPFALCIEAICASQLALRSDERLTAFALGAGLTMGWIIVLKQKAFVLGVPPMASWGLLAATIHVCVFCERRLALRLYLPHPRNRLAKSALLNAVIAEQEGAI